MVPDPNQPNILDRAEIHNEEDKVREEDIKLDIDASVFKSEEPDPPARANRQSEQLLRDDFEIRIDANAPVAKSPVLDEELRANFEGINLDFDSNIQDGCRSMREHDPGLEDE